MIEAEPSLVPPTYDEWVQSRTNGVGGSDVAAILGLSPWEDALSVYASKVLGHVKEDNDAMFWGRVLEPVVAKAWAERTGSCVVDLPVMWRSHERPWAIANVDRFVVPDQPFESSKRFAHPADSLGSEADLLDAAQLLLEGHPQILEVKTTGHFSRDKWADGAVPVYYQTQVQHYLDVLGLSEGWVAVLVAGQTMPEPVLVRRDDAAIALIREKVDRFWHDHVLPKNPPEATHKSRDTLRELYPDASESDDPVVLPPAARDLWQNRVAVKSEIGTRDEYVARVDARFMQWLADRSLGVLEDGTEVCTWNQTAGRASMAAMRSDPRWDEIAERFDEIERDHKRPGRTLRFKTPKATP